MLNAAIIGLGWWGRTLVESVQSNSKRFHFTRAATLDTEAVASFAQQHGIHVVHDIEEVLADPAIEAVVLATPHSLHVRHIIAAAKAGKHVFSEKPLALNLADAQRAVAACDDAGVVLAVGQTERFNPALAAARPLITDPRFIVVHRLGTFPERSLDIDVVFDLMIHDLDAVLSLVDSDVESLEAVGVPVITNRVDIANARLRFANGCIVNLTASRISRDRVRKIRFFQPSAYVSIDWATQKVEVYRLVKGSGPAPSIEGGELEVVNEEPLKRELADFVDAVVARRAPVVTGEAGRRALSVAQAIVDKMAANVR